MAKVNIRESLGRLDLLTDNKYDLRNTYDSSNISNDKKKKLAESISNNASAKQLYNILNEDYDDDYDAKYDATYEANSYYGRDYRGLEDNIYTDDFSELENWIWEKVQNGGYVEVSNRDSGKSVRLDPDNYDWETDDAYTVLDDLRMIEASLTEDTDNHEQLYKVVIQSDGGTKRDFESGLYENEAEEIVDYYGGRWIDESGFEWHMYVEEDDESTEHSYVDESLNEEKVADKIRAQQNTQDMTKRAIRILKNLGGDYKDLAKEYEDSYGENPLEEDTVKQNGKWVNKGEEGTHGKFKTKKAADAQRRAMFANGYKGESLEESLGISKQDKDELVKVIEDAKKSTKDYFDKGLSNNLYVTFGTVGMTLSKIVGRKEKIKFVNYWKDKSVEDIIKELSNQDWKIEESLKESAFDSDEYEREHILRLAKAVKEASKGADERKLSNLKKTAKKYLTNHKGTKHEKEYAILQKAYDSLLDEDWEPDEWEETDFLDNDGKKVYINIIKEAEDIDDLKDIAHDLYWHDKGLFAMLRNFPKDKSFEWIQNRMIEVIKSTMNESLNEDTYTTNEINKFIRRAMSMANSMKKDFYVVETYIEDGTQFNGYAVTAKVDPQDKAVVKASYKDGKVSVKKLRNESLTEASYGGAYDIEDDMFWTKDDLIEFSDAVCDKLTEKFGYQYDIADVGAESNNDMYILIEDTTHGIEADVSFRIKMSRIRSPRDLMKYLDTVVSQFVKKFEEEYQYYDFDESLNEDISKPDFVVGFYAGPVDDETLELVNPKKISQVDVSADELRARYGKTVDKLLNDYTSQTVDKLKNGNSTLKAMILNFAEKKARETGELDNKFRNEERKFLDTGIYMDSKLEEINYPFEDGIKKLSKQLGKMLLPKRESLTEDVYDEESDFGDGSVEEGDTFIEDGRTWSWIERIAGPVHLDFDNWSVWSARDWDYIEEKVKPLLVNKEEFNVEVLTKIYDEAEVAYFVVDEDTGFIDWGPVETQTEAQDFLNGKVEDWENDDEYDESLKESKQLKESSDITDNGYSYTLHYEDIGDGKEYDYEVSSDEMFDFLNVISWENGDGPEDINREDHEQWDNWVANNINDLIKKYEDDILDNFREDASQEEYDNRDSDDREFDY